MENVRGLLSVRGIIYLGTRLDWLGKENRPRYNIPRSLLRLLRAVHLGRSLADLALVFVIQHNDFLLPSSGLYYTPEKFLFSPEVFPAEKHSTYGPLGSPLMP